MVLFTGTILDRADNVLNTPRRVIEGPNELYLVRPLLNVAQTMRQSPSKGHANAESIQLQHAALRQHGSIAWALDINRGLCKARGSSYSKQAGSA